MVFFTMTRETICVVRCINSTILDFNVLLYWFISYYMAYSVILNLIQKLLQKALFQSSLSFEYPTANSITVAMASNTAMVKIMEISTLKYSPMTYFPHCIMKNGHFIQQPLESTENMLNHIILLFFLLINQAQRTIRNKYQQKEKIIVSFHIQFSCIQASWMTRFQ